MPRPSHTPVRQTPIPGLPRFDPQQAHREKEEMQRSYEDELQRLRRELQDKDSQQRRLQERDKLAS
jgi:hypothetical protein